MPVIYEDRGGGQSIRSAGSKGYSDRKGGGEGRREPAHGGHLSVIRDSGWSLGFRGCYLLSKRPWYLLTTRPDARASSFHHPCASD